MRCDRSTRSLKLSIFYYVLADHSVMHLESKHNFQLPNCIYKFHKQTFIVSSFFNFRNNSHHFNIVLVFYKMLYLATLYFNVYFSPGLCLILCNLLRHVYVLFLQLRVRCVIKFYILTYFLTNLKDQVQFKQDKLLHCRRWLNDCKKTITSAMRLN